MHGDSRSDFVFSAEGPDDCSPRRSGASDRLRQRAFQAQHLMISRTPEIVAHEQRDARPIRIARIRPHSVRRSVRARYGPVIARPNQHRFDEGRVMVLGGMRLQNERSRPIAPCKPSQFALFPMPQMDMSGRIENWTKEHLPQDIANVPVWRASPIGICRCHKIEQRWKIIAPIGAWLVVRIRRVFHRLPLVSTRGLRYPARTVILPSFATPHKNG